jgi:DNA/RNA endonuclease G (NUC1)
MSRLAQRCLGFGVVVFCCLLAQASFAQNLPYSNVQTDVRADYDGDPAQDNFVWGCPVSADLQDGNLILREAMALYYNPQAEWSEWVATRLIPANFTSTDRLDWYTDPLLGDRAIRAGKSKKDEFAGMYQDGPCYSTSYDRGHQVPDASWQGAPDEVRQALAYYSNISPQKSALNQGIWEELESRMMRLARNENGVYMMTGPLTLEQMQQVQAMDDADPIDHHVAFSNCQVSLPNLKQVRWTLPGGAGQPDYQAPAGYWKIVVVPQTADHDTWCGTFILGQEEPYTETEIQKYIWNIDAVEAVTGINFFPELTSGNSTWQEYEQEIESRNFYDEIVNNMQGRDSPRIRNHCGS